MNNKINKKDIIKKIEKEKNILREKGVKKIGIFGSVIRQKKNPRDIDILIDFHTIDFDNYMNVLFFLEKLLKKRVDLVIASDLRPELNYVKKEAEYVKI